MKKMMLSVDKAIDNLYCVNWSETDGMDVKRILCTTLVDLRQNKSFYINAFKNCRGLNQFQKMMVADCIKNIR